MKLTQTFKSHFFILLFAAIGYQISCGEIEANNSAPLLVDNAFLVAETAIVGEVIGTIQAVDLDDDPITYSIVNGNEEDKFLLDEVSGDLSVKNTLSAGQTQFYSLTVRADDGAKYSEKIFEIEVLDATNQKVIYTNLLTAAPWLYESVTLDGTADETWSNFELVFDGNVNGGSYTSEESPNFQIWPNEDTWIFEDRGTNIIRTFDDRKLTIDEISETRLVLKFTIGVQNARISQVTGDWVFTLIHE